MKYRCRCTGCRQRKSLGQKPGDYIKQPKCTSCGKRSWRIDRYRQRGKEAKRFTCYCDGYPFPHRRGSLHCAHCHEEKYQCSQFGIEIDRSKKISDNEIPF